MKECFKCNKIKPLTEFYKHPAMADGRVNKCKECNKKDVRENREKKVDYYREYDAFRYRRDDTIKERNARYAALNKGKDNHLKRDYVSRNPKKRAAHVLLGNAVRDGVIQKPIKCSRCNEFTPSRRLHGHHYDYNKPLDVIWLCASCHGFEHSKYKHLY